jgi:hypothetical protein
MSKVISKHILEIRHKSNSRFLDKRGEIAEILSGQNFDQWNIGNNRIDFASKKNSSIGAFLSYKNLGYFSDYPTTPDDFLNESKNFIKNSWTYFPTTQITRVGIRSAFLIETKNFKESFDKYKSKFLGLQNEDIKKLGGDLIDLGFPLSFAIGEEFFNVMTGPMKKKQLKEFALDSDELPESSIFIEVDYFRKEFSPHITQKNVLELIERGLEKAQKIKDEISKMIID